MNSVKKLFISIFLSAISVGAVAGNGYCDGRKTQAERDNCYRNAVQQQNYQVDTLLTSIYKSDKLTDTDKANFDQSHNKWVVWVNSACKNNVCVYNELVDRKNLIQEYHNKYVK